MLQTIDDDRPRWPALPLGEPQQLHGRAVEAFQQPEPLPGDRWLQPPPDVPDALALSLAPGGVSAGLGVIAQPGQHDGVQGAVELAVA
jgi:hypothetical protein